MYRMIWACWYREATTEIAAGALGIRNTLWFLARHEVLSWRQTISND
jgi:hypothetical protein